MTAPVYSKDFFGDEFIRDPIAHYAEMRALGPVLWLQENAAFAAISDKHVREILSKPNLYQSGKGLSLNDDVNALLIGNTLNSDGEDHARRRKVTAPPIMPKNLAPLRAFIEEQANVLAEHVCQQGQFDAVTEFAQILPISVVVDLVGLSASGQDKMLDWAAAAFNLFEGFNARSQAAFDTLVGLQTFLSEHGTRAACKEDGLARRIFDVAPDHGFSEGEAAQIMRDYINPSLDTTISAIGFAAYYFANFPEQWDILRAKPELVPNAVEEVVRLATPIRTFSRYVEDDTELAQVSLPKASRIFAVYAAANRDPDMWPDPDRFDVARNTRKHMGFGFGVHACMGMHLARLEMVSLLNAMLRRVSRWELDGTHAIAMNNTIRAFACLPVRVSVA